MGGGELQGLRIAIYARFSSEGQRDASIDDQIRKCREYVEARGGVVREELIFVDRAVSGTGFDRPGFARLVELTSGSQRRVDVIVAEHTDRLGRDAAELQLLFRSLEYARVRLVTLSGVDSTSATAHLLFSLESAFANAYIRDLRAKTMRGLEGRFLAGFATGGVPYGFTRKPEVDAAGKPLGSRPIIDPVASKVVVMIFSLYLDGYSLARIAKKLNADALAPPRVTARRRRSGWKDSTVRAILHNETYAGRWTFKEKEWRKIPGTNTRRYSERAASEVLTQQRPHLAIIDDETWTAVQERLRAVSAHYTRTEDGKPKGRSIAGRATPYLFSGLLHCAECGGKMVISGGSSKAYYRCETSSKRGHCTNKRSVPEGVVRTNLLDELRRRLTSPDAIAYARKRIAEKLGTFSRDRDREHREVRARLEKTERQIEKLVDFVAEGKGTKAVAERLEILEREATTERKALAALAKRQLAPIKLPTPDEMLKLVFDLERRLVADVTKGREELKRVFRDGKIVLTPEPGGYYTARSEILPLVLLTTPPAEGDQGGRDEVSRYSASSCAGAQRTARPRERRLAGRGLRCPRLAGRPQVSAANP